MSATPSPRNTRLILAAILLVGLFFRTWGLTDHWKNNDHYNYGGASTTHALMCLKQTPLSESRGIYHSFCGTDRVNYYPNHSPIYLWGVWAMTEIFGEDEASTRGFTLIFSMLNILLVYLIASRLWPQTPAPLLAAAFQAGFLGPIYFGTHLDAITEFTLHFMLISTLCFLKGKHMISALFALVAGFTAWVGFFQFPALVAVAALRTWTWRKENPAKENPHLGVLSFLIIVTGLAGIIGLGWMMWLHGTPDIGAFLENKLTSVDYVVTPTWKEKTLLPFWFVKNWITSHSRLLGPLFFALALWQFFFFTKSESDTREKEALILTGLPNLLYVLVGPKYAMVHIFLYIFWMPMFALLCARALEKFVFQRPLTDVHRKWLWRLTLLALLTYPYGIYKTHFAKDALISLALVSCSLLFCYKAPRKTYWALPLFAMLAFTNFNQMTNYRGESDSEYEFCQKAREEYQRSGNPIVTHERQTRTKNYVYCWGLPIKYLNP